MEYDRESDFARRDHCDICQAANRDLYECERCGEFVCIECLEGSGEISLTSCICENCYDGEG